MFEATSFEDKVAQILAGNFTPSISSNNSVSSTPRVRSEEKIRRPSLSEEFGAQRGIAAATSFISDVHTNDSHHMQISHSSAEGEQYEHQETTPIQSPKRSFDSAALRPDELTDMIINDDQVSVHSSPTISVSTPIMEEFEKQAEIRKSSSKSLDSLAKTGIEKKEIEVPPSSTKPPKEEKRVSNPKITTLDQNEGFLQIDTSMEGMMLPVASPVNSVTKGGARIVKPNRSNVTTPSTEVTPVRKSLPQTGADSTGKAKDLSRPRSRSNSQTASEKSLPQSVSQKSQVSDQPQQQQQQSQQNPPKAKSQSDMSQHLSQQMQYPPHSLESPTRFSTPSKLFSSPNSASSSVAPGERNIVVAVRVRPFNQSEKSQKARRTISKKGDDFIIVNPKAFDAEPDTVATAAIAIDHNPWAHAFRFDHCLWSYDPATSTSAYIDQVGVHESLGYDIVDQALSGISCSCFAYGHTSTGKTYSLFGKLPNRIGYEHKFKGGNSNSNFSIPRSAMEDPNSLNEESGLVPRVFHDIITAIKTNQISTTNSRIFISFLEIYNEKVIDLLADTIPSKVALQANGEWLKVREHPSYGPYVENLKKVEVFTVEDMFALIAKGNENRSTAQTNWNNESSRSHAIVTLELSSFDVNAAMRAIEASVSTTTVKEKRLSAGSGATGSAPTSAIKNSLEQSVQKKQQDFREFDQFKTIRVQMVDLAGSEKDVLDDSAVSSSTNSKIWSGSNYRDTTPNKSLEAAMDKEKTELKAIRRSLATLGYIIQSLSRGASFRSLPYRDSKLTFLLRDALKGSNHTTMLATVSPAHIYYEETLATLRYAEKLCSLGRKISVNAGTTSIALPLRDDRPQMIEEFRRYHSDLESARKSNLAAKQLLHFAVADPQQRIARITRTEVDYSTGKVTSAKKSSSSGELTFTSPIDGKMKRVRDLTAEDLDILQSTYRTIQSQVIELQIDLDAVRTDRDTLLLEVKGSKEKIQEMEVERSENNAKITNYIKSLKLAEKEVIESRTLLRRKEEHIERLIQELNESKQARINAEQAYHSRTKEFLVRFDNLKKENKSLTTALEMANNRDGLYSSEKMDFIHQINKLKLDLENALKTHDRTQSEYQSSQEDNRLLKAKVDRLEEVEQQYQDSLTQINQLQQQFQSLQEAHQLLMQERDSLTTIIEQKDALLVMQNQQTEKSLSYLHAKQHHPSTNAHSNAGHCPPGQNQSQHSVLLSEYLLLQQHIKLLLSLSKEDATNTAGSIDGHLVPPLPPLPALNPGETVPVIDLPHLITILKEIEEKFVASKQILSLYENEKILRKELEKKLVNCLQLLKNDEILKKNLQETNDSLTKQVNELIYLQKLTTEQAGTAAVKPAGPGLVTDSLPNPTDNPFITQIELLKKENTVLKQQLETTQTNYTNSKTELLQTQKVMQKEFSQLWVSIKELTNLDAVKDKSIQELVQERNTILKEKEVLLNKNNVLMEQLAQLQRELREVDYFIEKASFHATQQQQGGAHTKQQHQAMNQANLEFSRSLFDSLKQSRRNSHIHHYNYQLNEFSPHQGNATSAQANSHSAPVTPITANPITVTRHPSANSIPTTSEANSVSGRQSDSSRTSVSATSPHNMSSHLNHHQHQQQHQSVQVQQSSSRFHQQTKSTASGLTHHFQGSNGLPAYDIPETINEQMLVQQVEQLTEFIDQEKMRRIRNRATSSHSLLSSPASPGVPSSASRNPPPSTHRISPTRSHHHHPPPPAVESRSRVFSPNTRV